MTDPYDAYEALKPRRAKVFMCRQKHKFNKHATELGVIVAESELQASNCCVNQHWDDDWDSPEYVEMGELDVVGDLPVGFEY
jgi:hypothetical protein